MGSYLDPDYDRQVHPLFIAICRNVLQRYCLRSLMLLVSDVTTKSCKAGSMVLQADGCNYCKCSPRGELEPCTIRDCKEVAEHLRTKKFPPFGNKKILKERFKIKF
uniref:Pacifastin domain-containing protein n=1 Tax=Rhodnius prolixus TaxID=13249 RepID=T1HXU5_RHOPR